jgi:hypothetical protein
MKTPMKYTFAVGQPLSKRQRLPSPLRRYCLSKRSGAEQLSAAPHVTAKGRVAPVAKYRADHVAAAVTATQTIP